MLKSIHLSELVVVIEREFEGSFTKSEMAKTVVDSRKLDGAEMGFGIEFLSVVHNCEFGVVSTCMQVPYRIASFFRWTARFDKERHEPFVGWREDVWISVGRNDVVLKSVFLNRRGVPQHPHQLENRRMHMNVQRFLPV